MNHHKLKLFGTRSFDEVISKVAEHAAANPDNWIEGSGWDQNDWTIADFPNKDTLDKLFPKRPVFLLRVDGHAALVNQKALELAGLDKMKSIKGGEIMLRNGIPNGIVIDAAMEAARKAIPRMGIQNALAYLKESEAQYFEHGLTSIVECGVQKEVIDWLKEAYASGQLKLRTTMMLTCDQENYASFLNESPYKTDQLHIAGFKVFADGAMGSRGACLLHDYTDRAGHRGNMLLSKDSLRRIVRKVYDSPYQLCVHAIGDSANREVLTIYSDLLKQKNDRRWRVEHAQLVNDADMNLFGKYSIIPSVQPSHATGDMTWIAQRLGEERTRQSYRYKQLLEQNQWLPLGTDFPVEQLNPLHTFFAAVFRTGIDHLPQGGFQSDNALTREEALKGITIWAARSVFEEMEKGSLEPGKLADFVVLDTDLMKADATSILNTKVVSTFSGGRKVFGLLSRQH
jgi:predicted amidohydrolase YtcJ